MKQITLLPADVYFVINKTIISEFDKKVIIDLYQPIIGPLAVSLYFSFISDLDNLEVNSKIYSHHHLMVNLKNGLDVIKQARESLESVGLIKTFVKINDNQNNYIYELFSPLTPNEFFNHPILNVVLYNNIGENEYNNLINIYKIKKYDLKDYKDISKSINDTYRSIGNTLKINYEFKEKECLSVNSNDVIDFDLIISSIPNNILSDKAFNKKTKELINNLAFVYDIDNLRMIDLIRLSIGENGMIIKEKLINNVRKYYDFNNNGSLPTLIYRTQPEYLKQGFNDTSNRGKMLYVFENTSPYDFLMGKNKGIKPNSRDLKLLEYLAVELNMKPAVINVLIDYVLRINDNKLNKNYVLAIAGEWVRSNIDTATKAMERAEKEHKKNKNKVFVKKSETVPVWFNENNDKQDLSEDEKNELENLLKDFRWFMKNINDATNKYYKENLEKELLNDYVIALKNEKFKKLVKRLKLDDEKGKKYTSKLERVVSELNNCENCKGLVMCKNKVVGCVYYPEKDNDNLTFNYVACKYKKEQIREQEKKKSHLYGSNDKLSDASLGEIFTDDKKRVELIKWVTNFYHSFPNDLKGLYLHGSFGSGKTYIISALLNELARKNYKTVIIYYPELLNILKSTFDSKDEYNEVFNEIKTSDVLLIDDIGAETVTNWSRDEVLGTILQYRMEQNLTTFFTSNLTIDELETHLSIVKNNIDKVKARRIIERIKQLTTDIELISKNRRN